MFRSVEDEGDVEYLRKGVRCSFDRHMVFSTTTSEKIVRAFARAGAPKDALELVGPQSCSNWRLPVIPEVLEQLMLEVCVTGDAEGMTHVLNTLLASPTASLAPRPRALYYFTRGMAEAGNVEGVARGVLLTRKLFGSVPESIIGAAAPCLAEHGGSLPEDKQTAKRRKWRVFGLLAQACGDAAERSEVDRRAFSVEPAQRAAAREKNPDALETVAGALPRMVVDAFEALSAMEPPARTKRVLEQAAAVNASS
jgi:hypothetical protein